MADKQDVSMGLGSMSATLKEQLRELVCPACEDYCTPPIIQCLNGHNMCSKCRSKNDVCYTCKAKLSIVRNRLAEQLVDQLYPCSNHAKGCPTQVQLKDLKTHVASCDHGKTKCLIHILPAEATVFVQCPWKGEASKLFEHVKKAHPGSWSNNDNTKTICYKLRKQHMCLIAAHDHLFWSLLKYDFTAFDMRGSLFAVTKITPPVRFTFQYQFVSEDGSLDICKRGTIGDPGTYFPQYNSTIFQGKRMMDQLVNKDKRIKFKVNIMKKEA